jgi:hypothetical protein
MNKFKEMKIRITSKAHNIAVQGKLFELGYKWASFSYGDGPQFLNDTYALTTYNDGSIYRFTLIEGRMRGWYAEHLNEEYLLTPSGDLVAVKDYFKQPVTPSPAEKVYEPLPLQPFEQWVENRIKLIAEHVVHSLNCGMSSDIVLTKELYVLSCLLNNYKESV